MRRTELLKSTSFRLALIFSGLFLVSFVVAGALAYRIISTDLDDRLDRTIGETFQLISQSFGEGDLEDLVGTVQSYAAATQNGDRVFYLGNRAGARLAGNVTMASVPAGLSTVGGDAVGLEHTGRYRVFNGAIGDNRLVVGMSYDETEELGNLALSSFVWAGALASLIAILAGVLLAGAVQSRLHAIADTMTSVGRGELMARIPLRGSGDDVDVLAAQVNAALERLATLVEGMRQVSMDIAHDLKTPLNRLSVTIEGALEKAERGENNAVDLVRAQEEGRQLNATFEALLRIAQLESGARKSRFVEVSVSEVLAVLVEAYADVASEHGQELRYRESIGSPDKVLGDRDLLTQLFANLIENAIRHATGSTRIELAVSASPSGIEVSVCDEGPGIPAAERDKIFQRLYRLEKSRTTPGSGLGLSLVKAIADLHGAQIRFGDRHPGLEIIVAFKPADRG